MTDDTTRVISQELDALREEMTELRRVVTQLTDEIRRLEYRMGQQNRAMERMAQYTASFSG